MKHTAFNYPLNSKSIQTVIVAFGAFGQLALSASSFIIGKIYVYGIL